MEVKKRVENDDGGGRNNTNDKIIAPRDYQLDLLEKAKEMNAIVYLGTGSGKTFIAIMLIKHMRGELGRFENGRFYNGKKVVFLSPSVALVDQQAKEIENCTGLKVGRYTGADGVDDWQLSKWREEIEKHQVLCLVHDVFILARQSSAIHLKEICLMILDECHHAGAGDHSYAQIMNQYHRDKELGNPLPKILGLTACIVVKKCDVMKFRQEKYKLERKMDAKVVTTEEQNLFNLLQYVTAPDEYTISFTKALLGTGLADVIAQAISETMEELANLQFDERQRLEKEFGEYNNTGEVAKRDLERDFKKLKNEVLLSQQTLIQSIGLISAENVPDQLYALKRAEGRTESFYYSEQTRAKLFKKTISCLEKVSSEYCRVIKANTGETELQKIYKYSSQQFNKLVDELLKEKDASVASSSVEGLHLNDGQNAVGQINQFDNISCIIFVEQKSVAVRMCELFQKLSNLDPRFYGLKVDYVHSPSGGFFNKKSGRYVYTEESMAERRRIQEILAKFKSKELNVLVSTSVVEEGLDVRSCNLVIKYDFPATFRSYVQSKGRARRKPSKYLIFMDTAMSNMKKLLTYREVEEMSLKECHNSDPVDMEYEDESSDDIFYVDPSSPDTSPYVTGSKAISLVYKYIAKIPVDRFTRLAPIWKIRSVEDSSAQNSLFKGLGLCDVNGFYCDLHMPHKTPFRNKIQGPVRDSKEEAKRACALLAVKKLFELGELDNRLKVRKPEPLEDDESDEEEGEDNERRGRKAGTSRRRNFYEYKDPYPLNVQPTASQAYLYKISMVLEKPLEGARYKHYKPEEDKNSLGLVLGAQAQTFGPLNLYGPSGQLAVTVRFLKKIPFNGDFCQQAKEFHSYAFSKVLQIDHLTFDLESMMLVPLTNGEVNFNVMKDAVQLNNAVIQPRYIRKPDLYFVEEIVTNMSPKSLIRDTKLSHAQMFKQKHQIDIKDLDQPLLRISKADKKKFMFTPGDERLQDNSSNDLNKRSLMVPELMEIMPLPAGLWRQIQVVPYVIERMRFLLHSTKLSRELTNIKLNPTAALSLNGADSHPRKFNSRCLNLSELLEYSPHKVVLENLDLLECLTLKNCADLIDLERLEVLGDVFLKYSVGNFLFYAFKCFQDQEEETRTYSEGDMTSLRSKIVGNKNLLHIAMENLGLQNGKVNAVKINTHTNFLPPGATCATDKWLIEMDNKFPELIQDKKKRNTLSVGALLSRLNNEDLEKSSDEVLELAKDRFLNNAEGIQGVWTRRYRNISDKSLSDCIEAIIGAFLLMTGQKNTLQVMSGMGINCLCPGTTQEEYKTAINNLKERKRDFVKQPKFFSPLQDAFVNDRITDNAIAKLYSTLGIEEIENKIGYRFKEKSFLLQAFTHSSYSENNATDSYEWLEYLGDGVLDYIVTCYVFSNAKADGMDPGQLTEIRSALVCNNMFAGLLVDRGLQGNILYSAPAIRAKIGDYVSNRNVASTIQQRETKKSSAKSRSRYQKNKEGLMLLNETEPPTLEEVEVPKILGDVFEALIGAVFVDSGHDLSAVWKVYQRFSPNIDAIILDPPRNPKKLLHEHFQNVEFGKLELRDDHARIQVTLSYNRKTYRFAGLGNNRKMAEVAASKCALKSLNKRTY